jgi:hypothetical protein
MRVAPSRKYHYAGVVCKSARNGTTCGFRNFLRTLESAEDTDFGWFGKTARPLKCDYCFGEETYTREDLLIWETNFEPGFGLGLPLDKGRFGNP